MRKYVVACISMLYLIGLIKSFDSSTESLIKEYYDNEYKYDLNSELEQSTKDSIINDENSSKNEKKNDETSISSSSSITKSNSDEIKEIQNDSKAIINAPSTINSQNSNVEDKNIKEDTNIEEPKIEEMREEYSYWIRFKNSFTFNQDQKAKLARSFKPEEKSYFSNSCNIVWFVYIFVGILSFSLLVYLIGRFAFGKFLGPKQVIGKWYAKGYAITLVIFFISYTSFISVSFYYYNQAK